MGLCRSQGDENNKGLTPLWANASAPSLLSRLPLTGRLQPPGGSLRPEMNHIPDSLLDRLRQGGSKSDWDRFVDLYGPLLEQWARRLSPPGEVADLVQEVLLLVMQKLPSFAGASDKSFLAWLRTVLLNRWRDLGRRTASRPVVSDPTSLDTIVGDDGLRDVTDAEDRNLLVRRALQIMQSDFEPTTWRACWETVAADRPAADVAAELGVSVEVVYSASYRVIRRLRTELSGAWG